jgi:cytochrome bd-type quinol oxidase subunit 2
MFKKTIISAVIIFNFIAMPLAVRAADNWGLGIGSGGVSGGISGSSGSFSFGIGSGSGSGNGWNLGTLSGFGLPAGSITGIVINILNWILMIFGVVGIIGFVISGLMYLLAAGDDNMIERAKEAMKYSIIGVLVGLAGFVIIQSIAAILSVGYTI